MSEDIAVIEKAIAERDFTTIVCEVTTVETMKHVIAKFPEILGEYDNAPLGKHSALHSYVFKQNYDIVELLLQSKADPNVVKEHPPLFQADERCTELLLKYKANVNHAASDGHTALFDSMNGNIAKMLLANSADIRHRDDRGKTALEHDELEPGVLEVLLAYDGI